MRLTRGCGYHRHKVNRTVKCPVCNVEPGNPCLDYSNRPLSPSRSHEPRRLEARLRAKQGGA